MGKGGQKEGERRKEKGGRRKQTCLGAPQNFRGAAPREGRSSLTKEETRMENEKERRKEGKDKVGRRTEDAEKARKQTCLCRSFEGIKQGSGRGVGRGSATKGEWGKEDGGSRLASARPNISAGPLPASSSPAAVRATISSSGSRRACSFFFGFF